MGCRLSLGMGTEVLSMFTISKKVRQIQYCLQTFAYDSLMQGMKRKMLLQKAFYQLFQCFVNLCYGNPFNSSYPILFHLIFWHALFKRMGGGGGVDNMFWLENGQGKQWKIIIYYGGIQPRIL